MPDIFLSPTGDLVAGFLRRIAVGYVFFLCLCELANTYGHKKRRTTFVVRLQNLVRTKGLEPPRLSASDPKSDVATNYTMSAGSSLLKTIKRLIEILAYQPLSGAKVKTFL